MLKGKFKYIVFSSVFVFIEIILSIMLQVTEGREYQLYSVLAIAGACLFHFAFFSLSKDYVLTQIGLICTLCADYFLVWSVPQHRLTAMAFFSVTQIAYFLRIYFSDENMKRKKLHLTLRLISLLLIIIVTLCILNENTDALALVSMTYYVNLIFNMVFAFAEFKKHMVFAVGLLLFICCDTVVGLSMLDSYLVIPNDSLMYKLINPGFNLAWVFYVPSQVMISLSLLKEKIR